MSRFRAHLVHLLTHLPLYLVLATAVLPAAPAAAEEVPSHRLLLPAVQRPPLGCDLPEQYGTLSVNDYNPDDLPAPIHPDLNLAVRGYDQTGGTLGLVHYDGPVDGGAPQLAGLYPNNRTGSFSSLHKVYQWDWGCNCLDDPIAWPPVTLTGFATVPGETLHVPDRQGGSLGQGYKTLVLFATETQLTLHYTREDSAAYGYTIHLEALCVEPDLLALYRTLDAQGRRHLPALYGRQALGRASGSEVLVSIRDTGMFLDPRSRKDWWQDR